MVRGTLSGDAKEDAVARAEEADARVQKRDAPSGAGPLLEGDEELQAVAEPEPSRGSEDADDGLGLGDVESRRRLRGSSPLDALPAEPAPEPESAAAEEDAQAPAKAEAPPSEEEDPHPSGRDNRGRAPGRGTTSPEPPQCARARAARWFAREA